MRAAFGDRRPGLSRDHRPDSDCPARALRTRQRRPQLIAVREQVVIWRRRCAEQGERGGNLSAFVSKRRPPWAPGARHAAGSQSPRGFQPTTVTSPSAQQDGQANSVECSQLREGVYHGLAGCLLTFTDRRAVGAHRAWRKQAADVGSRSADRTRREGLGRVMPSAATAPLKRRTQRGADSPRPGSLSCPTQTPFSRWTFDPLVPSIVRSLPGSASVRVRKVPSACTSSLQSTARTPPRTTT